MDIAAYILLGALLAFTGIYLWNRKLSFFAQTPDDYAGLGPDVDIREHLNGEMVCEGVIYGPTGRVSARFSADFNASWDGDQGRIQEVFRYDSGTTQNREWRLALAADGSIEAQADDVVGKGKGVQKGPSVLLTYDLRLPKASGGHVLSATDWMYLIEDGVIINRSQFRKFGFKVAELVATIRPVVVQVERLDAA